MAERTLAELQHILGDDMDPNSLAAIGRRIGVVLPREDPDLWSQAMAHNLTQALREAAARRPWPGEAAENAAPAYGRPGDQVWPDLSRSPERSGTLPDGDDALSKLSRGLEPKMNISRSGAAAAGALAGASANFWDEVYGASEASGLPGWVGGLRAPVGAARLLYEKATGRPGEATEAYERGARLVRDVLKAAEEQHPGYYVGGNIVGSVAVPGGAALRAGTATARAARSAAAGAAFGGLSGFGEGEGMTDRLAHAGVGTVLGGALGAAAPFAVDATMKGARAVASHYGGKLRGSRAMSGADERQSVSAGMYPPPNRPQRPFAEDYSSGSVTADASGQLAADIEGRPLIAKHIAGRRYKDLADQGLSARDIEDLILQITGRPVRDVPGDEIKGAAGVFRTWEDAHGFRQFEVLRNKDLIPGQRELVPYHEAGHAIDDLIEALRGDWEHLAPELRYVFNDMNNPALNALRTKGRNTNPTSAPHLQNYGPKEQGYEPWKVMSELAAEAISAYAMNPNYFKSVAPNTAKFIREMVNANPYLSKIIQFNALTGLPAAGLAMKDQEGGFAKSSQSDSAL